MKDALLTVLATILSIIITGFGIFLVVYFLNEEIGIVSFLLGLVGYFIAIRPSVEEWEINLKKFFRVKD
jgi:hypothetical protein